MRVLLASDKLRGSATAREAARALGVGVARAGAESDPCPLSDGGEGFLEVWGGANRFTEASGPLGEPLTAPWRRGDETAVIESARVSGANLLTSPRSDEAERATSTGIGQLIRAAIHDGATRILVGLGGTASSDGGRGALAALAGLVPFRADLEVIVATDVTTPFLLAARVFGPQKGADEAAVDRLSARLKTTADDLWREFAKDVRSVPGGGAAGGTAGALWAAGATITSGFDLVAEHLRLSKRIDEADLVLTCEGRFDATSLGGKVTGSVIALSRAHAKPVAVIAGAIDDAPEFANLEVGLWSLSEHFGPTRSWENTTDCLSEMAYRLCLESISKS